MLHGLHVIPFGGRPLDPDRVTNVSKYEDESSKKLVAAHGRRRTRRQGARTARSNRGRRTVLPAPPNH